MCRTGATRFGSDVWSVDTCCRHVPDLHEGLRPRGVGGAVYSRQSGQRSTCRCDAVPATDPVGSGFTMGGRSCYCPGMVLPALATERVAKCSSDAAGGRQSEEQLQEVD